MWAFGALLYEMLSGRRAFAGETLSDTFAAIMRDEPDWSALPDRLSPRWRRLPGTGARIGSGRERGRVGAEET